MKFFWVKEDGGDGVFLMDEQSARKWYTRVREATDATAKDFAEFCDQEAENGNYHSFVGAHEALVGVLSDAGVNDELATAVMREIAERGGLHEMGS